MLGRPAHPTTAGRPTGQPHRGSLPPPSPKEPHPAKLGVPSAYAHLHWSPLLRNSYEHMRGNLVGTRTHPPLGECDGVDRVQTATRVSFPNLSAGGFSGSFHHPGVSRFRVYAITSSCARGWRAVPLEARGPARLQERRSRVDPYLVCPLSAPRRRVGGGRSAPAPRAGSARP